MKYLEYEKDGKVVGVRDARDFWLFEDGSVARLLNKEYERANKAEDEYEKLLKESLETGRCLDYYSYKCDDLEKKLEKAEARIKELEGKSFAELLIDHFERIEQMENEIRILKGRL